MDSEPVGDALDGDGLVREVERQDVEQVEKNKQLGDDKVLSSKKVAPEEVEDVGEGKVGTDDGNDVRLVGLGDVFVEEGLGDEEELP